MIYIDGVFDGSGDSPRIYLVAENLDAARVKKVILHEAVGHQGMRQIFGDSFNDFLRQIGSEHSAEIQEVAKRRSLDTSIDAKYLEAVEEFLAEKSSLGVENGTTWQKICAAFRQFLRNMGLNIAYSDNDIQQLFRQSLRAVQGNGQITDGNGTNGAVRYTLQNAQPSKEGYTVEYVNENAGNELNNIDGVICPIINDIMAWNKSQWNYFFEKNNIQGKKYCKALNKNVEVHTNLPKRLKGHTAYADKLNLIAVIPEMLDNAILIQSEFAKHNNRNIVKSHLLATKVRIGTIENGKRYLVGIIIHEDSMGNLYYDHEMTDINNGDISASNKGHNLAEANKPPSTIKIIQKVLLSSGFDVNSEKNLRFSIAPQVDTPEFKNWFKDSKVVDENGKPLVVYHGSGTTFWEFKTEFTGLGKNMYEKENQPQIYLKG